MSSIIELPGVGPVIKLKGFYDDAAVTNMSREIASMFVYYFDPEGRGRNCLIPINEVVPLAEIKTRLNVLSFELRAGDSELRSRKRGLAKNF